MKKIILFLGFFVALISDVFAQNNGEVWNAGTMERLEGVNIFMLKDSVGLGTTDGDGKFDLCILRKCARNDTIMFSFVGFTPMKCTVDMLKSSGYRVSLFEEARALGEVTVSATNGFSYYLSYDEKELLPIPLYSFASFMRDGKIYVLAGDETEISMEMGNVSKMYYTQYYRYHSPSIYVYDVKKNVWTIKKNKLLARAYHVAQLYGDRAFVLGGIHYSTNKRLEYTDEHIEVYDLAKDTVYSQSSNLHLAKNPVSFVYDNLLFVMGGSTKEYVYNSKIHALDLKSGYWYEIGEIPERLRREMNGVLVGNTAYFFGGRRIMKKFGEINSYNVQTGEWKYLGDLKEMVSFPGLAVQGDLIFIYENKRLQVYNCRTNTINSYPINLELENSALHIYDNKLYIVGGCERNGELVVPSNLVVSIDISRFCP